jgi:hypothetical protein
MNEDDSGIEIENIVIFLETKIPNMKAPIKLTKSILYISENDEGGSTSEYPYFTNACKLPKQKLINMSYKDIVGFFFNKKIFANIMNKENRLSTSLDSTIDYNINTMIMLLFPTVYPSENLNTNSYDNVIKKNKVDNGIISFVIDSFVAEKNVRFSYIKVNSTIYTITSTCILNDFLNHPEFSKLYSQYIEFDLWFLKTKKEIKNKLSSMNITFYKMETRLIKEKLDIRKEILLKKGYNERNSDQRTVNYIRKIDELLKQLFDKIIDKNMDEINNVLENEIFRFSRELMDLRSIVKDITYLIMVEQKYFTEFNNEYTDRKIKQYLDSNYRKYDEFIKEIKKFSSDNRKMNNSVLQESIDEFCDGRGILFINYLKYIKSHYFDKKYKKFDNVFRDIGLNVGGVTTYENPDINQTKYQVYVALDLIGGELNLQNMNQISCDYKNEELGGIFKSIGNTDNNNFIITTLIQLESMIKTKTTGGKNTRKKQVHIIKKKKKIRKITITKKKKNSN